MLSTFIFGVVLFESRLDVNCIDWGLFVVFAIPQCKCRGSTPKRTGTTPSYFSLFLAILSSETNIV
jgi:hypothetical protein